MGTRSGQEVSDIRCPIGTQNSTDYFAIYCVDLSSGVLACCV